MEQEKILICKYILEIYIYIHTVIWIICATVKKPKSPDIVTHIHFSNTKSLGYSMQDVFSGFATSRQLMDVVRDPWLGNPWFNRKTGGVETTSSWLNVSYEIHSASPEMYWNFSSFQKKNMLPHLPLTTTDFWQQNSYEWFHWTCVNSL